MSLNREPKYPSQRAYVVKVRGDVQPDALAGRLENLVTGRSREFASSGEFLRWIAEDLAANAGAKP